MPRYDYKCFKCGDRFELEQSIKDDSITYCEICKSNKVQRIIRSVGISFKGSGFYVNDK